MAATTAPATAPTTTTRVASGKGQLPSTWKFHLTNLWTKAHSSSVKLPNAVEFILEQIQEITHTQKNY